MLRSSKALGNGSSLLPFNVDYVEDLPWDLAFAITHGLTILNWQENLISDEMPPRWMWEFDDELEKWFDEVKEIREAKFGGGNPHKKPKQKTDYSGEGFMQNDLAKDFSK